MEILNDEMLKSAIGEMKDVTFDSHKIIRQLMRANPHAYVKELAARLETDDPIRATHVAIGKALLLISLIEKVERTDSQNVRSESDDETSNMLWKLSQ